MRPWMIVTASVLGCSLAAADPLPARPCRSDPRVIGECFEVRGRLRFGNGNPALRMWRVGTNRILGIWDDEEPIVPANLATALEPGLGRTVSGDFLVCPFTVERAGWMRMVCIESARNLAIRDAPGQQPSKQPLQPTRTAQPDEEREPAGAARAAERQR